LIVDLGSLFHATMLEFDLCSAVERGEGGSDFPEGRRGTASSPDGAGNSGA